MIFTPRALFTQSAIAWVRDSPLKSRQYMMSAFAINTSLSALFAVYTMMFSRPGIQSRKAGKSDGTTTWTACPLALSQWYTANEEPNASPSGLWCVVITICLGLDSSSRSVSDVNIQLLKGCKPTTKNPITEFLGAKTTIKLQLFEEVQ